MMMPDGDCKPRTVAWTRPLRGVRDMLKSLISRGDQVAIVDGILQIIPASGKPVPDDWYSDNKQRLITEITKTVSVTAYRYDSYSTGRYKSDQKGLYFSGVTLQFVNVVTGENPHAIFNAGLKRSRTTKSGKKGDPLPKGRFNITKNYAFFKFWERAKIPHPRRLSEYHEHMGKLRNMVFTMELNEKGKAVNDSLMPLSVSYDAIASALNIADFVRQEVGKSSAIVRQEVGSRVRQASSAAPYDSRLTGDSSYGADLLRIKLIRKDGNRDACVPLTDTQYRPNTDTPSKSVKPQDQHLDDWLADYGS